MTSVSPEGIEDMLLNHPALAILLGISLYLPAMTILFMLFLMQIPISIILHFLSIKSTTLWISSVLHWIRPFQNNMNLTTYSNSNNSIHRRCTVSILQLNAFSFFGRFWTRKPLMEDMIRALSPDIISVNEAIRSRIWNFGTVQMISNLFDDHCSSLVSSPYEMLKEQYPILFQYSFIWDYIIGELQLTFNVMFLLPFFRKQFWKVLLKADSPWPDVLFLLLGGPLHVGNILLFRGLDIVNPDHLTLPANRSANRGMYIHPKDHQKRLWIVNTHLTASAESKYNVEQQQIEQIESILEWMEKTVNDTQCPSADAMVFCGDFNAIPGSKVYNLMIDRGFKSCACDSLGTYKYCTYESLTWTLGDGIDDDVGKILTLDYVWAKPLRDGVELKIEDCRIVGKNYKKSKHRGEDIKVFPSDHYGVFVKLSW